MAKDWQAVAKAINTRMAERSIGQAELANQARVAVATLRQIQHGVPKERNPRTLAALSEALGWPANHLEQIAAGQEPDGAPDRLAQLESALAGLQERVVALEQRIESERG
ncbi:XRE family transcriptional regulator [Amycolatopsis thermophila]|uniref:Transcriptional regulator with XRE-family HTH domain n=1 Tax=Amycolatopsis thermophila TaxID=206084 RepID=A0ABU0ETG8_9PSEU|nr:XRE family transcriptional regulator [Amycolatopsis thermophila]MDQ0378603.1 transcriptional regulator with XRE-family HTH domain [Amycolatopsis thermophila]